jgi:hypothetical protein
MCDSLTTLCGVSSLGVKGGHVFICAQSRARRWLRVLGHKAVSHSPAKDNLISVAITVLRRRTGEIMKILRTACRGVTRTAGAYAVPRFLRRPEICAIVPGMKKGLWIAFYCIADHRIPRLHARAVSASRSERVFEACLPAAKTSHRAARMTSMTTLYLVA